MSACTTAQQGPWSSPATWCAGTVPGPGDTVTIRHPVTLDIAADIGTSTPDQTCLTINASFQIDDDATLTLRGNVVQAERVLVTAFGGGRIVFDATRANPPTTNWVWNINAYALYITDVARLIIRGTPTRRFRVLSAAGGGNGFFFYTDSNSGGSVDAAYCDFIRIGDATHNALTPQVVGWNFFQLDHCVFHSCGGVVAVNPNTVTAAPVTNCVFTAPLSVPLTVSANGSPRPPAVYNVSDNDLAAAPTGGVCLGGDLKNFTVGGNTYRGTWTLDGTQHAADAGPFPPTYLSLTYSGPSSVVLGQTAATFTVSLAGGTTPDGPVTVTPSDGGAGGTFTPNTLQLTAAQPAAPFTYTPTCTGARTITLPNNGRVPAGNGALWQVDPLVLTVTQPATTYTITGPNPAYGAAGAASAPVTVALPPFTTVTGAVTITPSDGGGGLCTPAAVTLSTASPSAAFTYTPSGSAGSRTIRLINNGGLPDPPPIAYMATLPATSYTLTGPAAGDCSEAASFTLSLPPGLGLVNPVSIALSASCGEGTFAPSSLVLSNAAPTATFTYTPSSVGARTIVARSGGALTDPDPVAFLARAQIGSTIQIPPCVGPRISAASTCSRPVICGNSRTMSRGTRWTRTRTPGWRPPPPRCTSILARRRMGTRSTSSRALSPPCP